MINKVVFILVLIFSFSLFGEILKPCQVYKIAEKTVLKYPYYVNQKKFYISPALLVGIVKQESEFNTEAKSHAGAYGLTQIMPKTAELLKCDYAKLNNPEISVECSTKFLAALLTYNKGDLVKTERIRPYTKEMLVQNFPPEFQKFSGKGMFFSIVEDDLGRDKNACILIESLKSHESIIKMIQRFGADAFTKDRCYFYIISGNEKTLEILKNRIKNYRRKIVGADGIFIKYEENSFRGIRIFYRYFPELDEVINRG